MSRLQYKHIVAIAFVSGLFMDILDTTIVNVALPSIQADFGASEGGIEWVVTGYLLSLAVWIPASGWLGDRFGTKKIFLLALFIFTTASALCGLAWSLPVLIAFRILQGVGGGMLTPVGTAMLFRAYPPLERPRASSILAMVTVLAPAIGPVLGGYICTQFSWQWIFFVNVPIGIGAFIFAALKLKEHKEPTAGAFDIPGFVLAGLGLGLVLLGLSEGPQRGWSDPLVLASLVGGVVGIVVLVWVETHKAFPMLDLALFRDRSFRTPNIVSFAATGALMGVLFLLPLLLQGPRGLSALQSGLTTFPQALGVLVTARLVGGFLYSRVGPRRLAMIGMGSNAVITAMFLLVDLDTSQWLIRLLMFSRGLSLGFIFIPVQTAAFARVTPARTGRASALFQTQRQVGAAVGVAVLATMLVQRFANLGGTDQSLAQQATAFVDAFHFAIFGSVVLCLIGFLAATRLRDEDAAPTMRRMTPSRAVASPSPAGAAEVH